MRNPLRSEAEAFRFLLVVIAGAAAIVALAYANEWAGVAAAVIVVGGIAWWLWRSPPPEPGYVRPLASETPGLARHRVLLVAAPGTGTVAAPAGATEVVVLVPALASAVEAITGAVDDRREEAERTAAALAAQLPNARGLVGADDPTLAVEDALRAFGADEVVVAGGEEARAVADAIRTRVAVPVSVA